MKRLWWAVLAGFLLLFLVWPMLSLVAVGFTGEPVNLLGRWLTGRPLGVSPTLRYYIELFNSQRYYKGLVNSLVFSSAVTLASCLVGASLALVLARTAIRAKSVIRVLAVLPMAIPPYLMALSFMILFGKTGMVTRLLHDQVLNPFTPLATGLVQVLAFFPIAFLTTSTALARLDASVEEAGRVCGGPQGFVFWTVTVPLLRPGLAAGAFLTFVRSFGDFATPLLLLPPSIKLIVVEAYRDMSGNTYWGGAAMLSTVMVLVVLGVMGVQKYVERHRFETLGGRASAAPRLYSGRALPWLSGLVWLIVLLPLLNLGVLGLLSLAQSWGTDILPSSWTLDNYRDVFTTSSQYLVNSLVLSGLAVLLGLLLGFSVAYTLFRTTWKGRHWLDVVVGLPFVVPGTAFAIALVTVFNEPPLALHLTATLVVIAYVVTRAPYAVRSVTASLSQIGSAVEESSRTLGAPPGFTLWKVLLPLIRPGLLSGGLMIFISCMTDVSITLMICPPASYPASIRIFTETQVSHYFAASAYGITLMLFSVLAWSAMLRIDQEEPCV